MYTLTAKQIAARPYVRAWLIAVALLVFTTVIVGGATRLTDSGLSITEWQPIIGTLPPLSQGQWQEAFSKYQAIPEYKLINKGMSLQGFKFIFWWEWAHRNLGRFVGVAFLVPLILLWRSARLERGLRIRLGFIGFLGAAQGLMGWYMVKSGLVERTDVSQYRLAAHLALATVIFAGLLWVAFDIDRQRRLNLRDWKMLSTMLICFAVLLQIVSGAFVAGLDAGQGYNTWPLMDGAIIPEGLGIMKPWWLNFFENALTVQFQHRMIAYGLVVFVLVHAMRIIGQSDNSAIRQTALLLVILVLAQTTLGVWTLVMQVKLPLALTHQAGAMILLAAVLWHLHQIARVAAGQQA